MSTGETGTVEPLRFEDGALLVLDQRRCPRERWIRCDTVEQVADCIRTLAVRGAPAIGLAAAYGMALANGREAAAELLRSTRPTAVNLAWALEQCRDAPDPLEAARRPPPRAARGRPAARRPRRRAVRERHARAHPLQRRRARHGGYGTACGVLRAAWERGRLPRSGWTRRGRCSRGAPDRLGAAQAGIPHRVVADSAAGSLMARGLVDRVVVGADRIAANGDVANKVGTYPLAVLAAAARRAVLRGRAAVDDRSRDARRRAIPIEERDPAEVLEGGEAFNPAFDVTPAELVTAIVTEAGVLEPPYEESIARGRRVTRGRCAPPSSTRRARCSGSGSCPAPRAT